MSARIHMPSMVWVATGSGLGACARWGLGIWMHGSETAIGLPWGTLAANVAGSALIGLYAALTAPEAWLKASPAQRQFVMAGFCGGFTTFSLFTAELLSPLERGQTGLAALVLATSVAAWLFGVSAGYATGMWLNNVRSRLSKG